MGKREGLRPGREDGGKSYSLGAVTENSQGVSCWASAAKDVVMMLGRACWGIQDESNEGAGVTQSGAAQPVSANSNGPGSLVRGSSVPSCSLQENVSHIESPGVVPGNSLYKNLLPNVV